MSRKIILIGGFHEIVELCEDNGYSIVGIVDNMLKDEYCGYPILGTDDDAKELFQKYGNIPLVITPDIPAIREKLYELYLNVGFKFVSIISSLAKISKSSFIGLGTIVQAGVNISAQTKVGNFVKLNTGSNVMHDCHIGDFVTIAPNAVILGRIKIGNSSYIGANATILPDKTIGENVIVGAGAVVTKDIDENNTVHIGIPAKKIGNEK